MTLQRVLIIDSHTAGEPTRIVVEGGPDLGRGPLAERRERFTREFDPFRSSVANEPRGSDVVVGALLVPPTDPSCCAGVIFFNNVGTLGMCGHGTIGLAVTLAHLGRIRPGTHKLETPVGVVPFTLADDSRVSLENVPSYRYRKDVEVTGHRGDIAWGGNWFFLTEDTGVGLEASNHPMLSMYAQTIMRNAKQDGVTGENGAVIDHVEIMGRPDSPRNHGRNFVLCHGERS